MRHVDEYRDPAAVAAVVKNIHATVTRPWTLMEVCGGQTHSILKFGMDELLPEDLRLVHGPGCPVCVTPLELIDRAVAIAARPDVTFCSFGDMLRVPGLARRSARRSRPGAGTCASSTRRWTRCASRSRSRSARSSSSPWASRRRRPPMRWPCTARAAAGLENFSVLVAHVLVPPAMEALLTAIVRERPPLQGLLAPGHVCTVTGYRDYEPLAEATACPSW